MQVFGYGAAIIGFGVKGFLRMSMKLYEDEFADLVDLVDDAKPLFDGNIKMHRTCNLLRNDQGGDCRFRVCDDTALPKHGGFISPLANAPEGLGG